ncbi:M23 family metallopeptidase [Chryseobacterium sp. 6424]|uniref:M23 family metallopeptidase n=1 Tax=Chryseobacterium sp. 6424 TaxID=2039166 RepID=UPI003977DC70
MKNIKNYWSKRNKHLLLTLLLLVIFGQAVMIGKLFSERDHKSYEVNLVKINTEKDSVDYLEMKNNLSLVDQTVRELNAFLAAKNLSDARISVLAQDSISDAVYLAKQTNRYSQYLMDLQDRLQKVPLGIPTSGYISSNFGQRKNPIPVRNVLLAAVKPAKPAAVQYAEEKDSLGNIIRKPMPAPVIKNDQPKEQNQMQFHKGIDIAVAYGTDVVASAKGKVIFAGQKGGYGKCVIVSHGNGLATLYAHLSDILVAANDEVKVHQVIAKSGNSGRSTGPHLHYEVHKNNTPVNPKLFMQL